MDYASELSARRKRRRRFLLVFGLITINTLIGGGAFYLAFFTNFLYFQEVNIAGLYLLNDEDLWADNDKTRLWARPEFNSPLIKTASIHRDLIRRKLNIAIEERKQFAIWCSGLPSSEETLTDPLITSTIGYIPATADCYWLDADGFIFARAPGTEGELLYGIYDVSGERRSIGDYVLPTELRNVFFKVIKALALARVPVSYFRVEKMDLQEITAVIINGPEIYFSLRIDPGFAVEPLKSLQSQFASLRYIDFRSENKVYYQ